MNPQTSAPVAPAPAPAAPSTPAAPVTSNVTPVPAHAAKVHPPRHGKKSGQFTSTTKSA